MSAWVFSEEPKGFQWPAVEDQTLKPSPIDYPILLPTQQTVVGMATCIGPVQRPVYLPSMDSRTSDIVNQRVACLRDICPTIVGEALKQQQKIHANFQACSMPITKTHLLDYLRYHKRIDVEQAVAMVIAYLNESIPLQQPIRIEDIDDFEESDETAVHELLKDEGVTSMLQTSCMWRVPGDFRFQEDPKEVADTKRRQTILNVLGHQENVSEISDHEFAVMLQHIRRRRKKCDDSQHLTMPVNMIPEEDNLKLQWSPTNNYRFVQQEPIADENCQVVPKRIFRVLDRLLYALQPWTDATKTYIRDVQALIKNSGATSKSRIAALEASEDPFAIAYGFIAAQRGFQLKVVGNQGWSFLQKGEGSKLLQNRPEVLTSFENILVRHAHDLRALTAIKCPQGLRDHFSLQQDILDRARDICELMEGYVDHFGDGKMENLANTKTRGPVDFYNALCDELRDCSARAKAAGFDLQIGPVYKFLARDIMGWNKSWDDDAFAGGKIPGWVEYLARVRAEEINLS